MTTTDILKLIKCIDISKAMGEDQIPPKLITTANNFLVEPLTNIMNSCFSTSTFPDLGKSLSYTCWQGCIDKHIYTNYRTVSVLNTFSKIIESWIFGFYKITASVMKELAKHANEFLQIFAGAYRELYNNQNILIRLIEECKMQLDKN